MRQIILDTETTGLEPAQGHKIIEIGAVELIDRKLTGNHFHYYINPQREVEASAIAVHGITNEFLKDKKIFIDIAQEFMDFIGNAELIIHNAAFDLGFLDHELKLTKMGWKKMTDYCSVIDTLMLARRLHPGQKNNLDALCKRYFVDNTKRDLHGALLDANLLAQVYLAMTGGQGSLFDEVVETKETTNASTTVSSILSHHHDLLVLKASEDELSAHEAYLDLLAKKGACIWRN